MLLAVVKCWIVLVAGQEDVSPANAGNMQDFLVSSPSTEATVSTTVLTNYPPNLVGVEEASNHISETYALTRSTVQYSSTESPSELNPTYQERTGERSELGRTTQLVPDYRGSEPFNGLSESGESGNDVLETTTGVGTLVDLEAATYRASVTATETGLPTSTAPSPVTLQTEEAPPSEQVSVTEPDATVPSYPDINDVSSSTEAPRSPLSTASTSVGKRPPQDFHCIGPGRFPARPSCTEYHVCRLAGFWFVHFRKSCHFGLQFSLRLGFCVPSYLSDCQMDSYFGRGYSRSREFDDDSQAGQSGEVSRRNLLYSLMNNGRNWY